MSEQEKEKSKVQKPILHLNERSYVFSNRSIFTFIIGGPSLCLIIYWFLSLRLNYWLYELNTKQVVFLLNSMFKVNSQAILSQGQNYFPVISIPNHPFIGEYTMTTECIGAHVISIFIGLIICVPASKDISAREDFKWRKAKTLVISISVIYISNIFRIVFLLYFNFMGIPFEFIHQSIYFLSAIAGALFFTYILHRWLPEIFISIYYVYPLISKQKIKN